VPRSGVSKPQISKGISVSGGFDCLRSTTEVGLKTKTPQGNLRRKGQNKRTIFRVQARFEEAP